MNVKIYIDNRIPTYIVKIGDDFYEMSGDAAELISTDCEIL